MISNNILSELLGQPINSDAIQGFFDKYKINTPKRQAVCLPPPHMDSGYLYIDGKQQCGLFFIFQVAVWHPYFEWGPPTGDTGDNYPLLSTIIAYDHPNGLKDLPIGLKYGMDEMDIRKLIGNTHNVYVSPVADLFEAPKEWFILDSKKGSKLTVQLFEGEKLNKVTLTINTYKPIIYVTHPFHYGENEKFFFIKWAIRNNYFEFSPPFDNYKEQLTNEDIEFIGLLRDTIKATAVYIHHFNSDIHHFIFNYFTNDFAGERPGYEQDYKACNCDTIIGFLDDEEKVKKKLKNHEELYKLISKRLEEFTQKNA